MEKEVILKILWSVDCRFELSCLCLLLPQEVKEH